MARDVNKADSLLYISRRRWDGDLESKMLFFRIIKR